MEVDSLTSCTYFPPNGVFFNNIVLYDTHGRVTPSWVPVPFSGSPSCGFAVKSDSASFVYLYDTVVTVQPPSPPPESVYVTIAGPSRVPAHRGCIWTAAADGGTAPYVYSWLVNGRPVGGDSSTLFITTPSSPFVLSVVAVDSIGRANGQDLTVNVGGVQNCYEQRPIGK